MSEEGGFAIEQLMELAGLSVACAISKEYPPVFAGLMKQLNQLELPVLAEVPSLEEMQQYKLVVDGIFGFSFKGWRGEGKDAPFDVAVDQMASLEDVPVASIDIPSGWNVEDGPTM